MTNEQVLVEQVLVEQWLDEVVIGLNLCPFASKPRSKGQIRFVLSTSSTDVDLLTEFDQEIRLLESTPAKEIETTIIIVPAMLADFEQYNQFLDLVDDVIYHNKWDGLFQVASFHPDYCFADTHPDDSENLTNRSPFPLLHLLREESMEKALANMASPDEIFKRNIKAMASLSIDKIKKLFPYLKLS
ncbi:MAG: hypothetical protein COA90_01705 [Gammaproteobacteria bacterium]|nr:MAG: hypothetical protein COA90_01705 [Gammaproteobacteria bacterium]